MEWWLKVFMFLMSIEYFFNYWLELGNGCNFKWFVDLFEVIKWFGYIFFLWYMICEKVMIFLVFEELECVYKSDSFIRY